MYAARTVNGTSEGKTSRDGWICVACVPDREGLTVCKKPDTCVEEADAYTTERDGLPQDPHGANIERETIK